MDVRGVHHIGVVVRDAQAAALRLAAVGLPVHDWEDYGPGLLRIGFIRVGQTLVELIEPLTADGFNAEWLRTRGEGIQHIALAVGDIHAMLAELRAAGLDVDPDAPRPGAKDTLIAFLPEALTPGFLVELTQDLAAHGARPEGSQPR